MTVKIVTNDSVFLSDGFNGDGFLGEGFFSEGNMNTVLSKGLPEVAISDELKKVRQTPMRGDCQ